MPKEKLFDWFTFLTKKILKSAVFNIDNVFVSFWVDKHISQENPFAVHALFANSWNSPVTLTLNIKVSPKVLFATKKKAQRLILPRQWNIELAPAQIALVTAPGYAAFNCKPSNISFNKAKVSKQPKSRCLLKRRAKSIKASFNPLGLLLFPLGFVVISFSPGAVLNLNVKKNKNIQQDDPQNLQTKDLIFKPVWSIDRPEKLNISPVLEAYYPSADDNFIADIKNRCNAAYSKWARKNLPHPSLEVLKLPSFEQNQRQPQLSIY